MFVGQSLWSPKLEWPCRKTILFLLVQWLSRPTEELFIAFESHFDCWDSLYFMKSTFQESWIGRYCPIPTLSWNISSFSKLYSWKKADFKEEESDDRKSMQDSQNSVIKKHFPFDKASRGTGPALLETQWWIYKTQHALPSPFFSEKTFVPPFFLKKHFYPIFPFLLLQEATTQLPNLKT